MIPRSVAVFAAALLVGIVLLAPYALTVDARSGLAPTLSQGAVVSVDGFPPRASVLDHPARVTFARPAQLDPATDALLVVAPSVGYRDEEIVALRGFVVAGGRLLVADDRGVGSDLLERLSLGIRTTSTSVYSPAFQGDPERLVALSTGALARLPAEVVLSSPALVEGGVPVLLAPELAWLDLDDDRRPDLGEPLRAGAVAARATVGAGEVIVVGDADAFDASQRELAQALLAGLTQDGARRLVVDEGHRALSDPLGLNGLLSGRPGAVALTGMLMLAAVVGAAALAPRVRRADSAASRARATDAEALAALEELG